MLWLMTIAIALTLGAAKLSRTNGWFRRYLWVMLGASLVNIASDNILAYALVESVCLASVAAMSAGWAAAARPLVRWLSLCIMGLFCVEWYSTQAALARSVWGYLPEANHIALVSLCVLATTGVLALVSVPWLAGLQRKLACALGSLWTAQACTKFLLLAGWASNWPLWMDINQWLGPLVVTAGMAWLLDILGRDAGAWAAIELKDNTERGKIAIG